MSCLACVATLALLDVMIAGTADNLNEIEFVSRDVEWSGEKRAGSWGWIDCAMKLRG
jgi:hypothetical protein